MKRPVVKAIIKMAARSILLTVVIGAVIGVIGHISKWDSLTAYSDAFFLAGCLMIIAGASSRFAAAQGSGAYRLLHAESFRDMSSSERVDFIMNVSSPLRTVILGVLTGIWLIIISAIAANMS